MLEVLFRLLVFIILVTLLMFRMSAVFVVFFCLPFKLGFGRSEVMAADLSGSFTFLTLFMLVLEENVGSSWRLKADFDDSFTFAKLFCWPLGSPGGLGLNSQLAFGPQNWSKIRPTTVKNGVKKLIYFRTIFFYWFWSPFWVHFGSNFGVKVGQEAPTCAQEGPQEPQSTEKQQLQKVWFYPDKTILFESWRFSRRA